MIMDTKKLIPFHLSFDNRWTLRNVLTGVNTIMNISAMLIAVVALLISSHRQREDKAVEMTSYFQQRYADVSSEREALSHPAANRTDSLAHPHRCHEVAVHFWNLQLEQYQFWRKGLIPQEFFEYWMRCRHYEEGKAQLSFGTMSYLESWEYAKGVLNHPEFASFMDAVLKGDLTVASTPSEHSPDKFLRWLLIRVGIGVVILLVIIIFLLGRWRHYFNREKRNELADDSLMDPEAVHGAS